MTKVQNKIAEVENNDIIADAINVVVHNSSKRIMTEIVNLDSISHLAENISNNVAVELKNSTFLVEDLELTALQKEKIESFIKIISTRSKDQYLEQIDKDVRTKNIIETVKLNLDQIIEEVLSSIAKEVNRGVMISCAAVSADCKNDKHNKVELHYSKFAGDITIPTNCLLISTNCLELIKNSIVSTAEKTGEIKE